LQQPSEWKPGLLQRPWVLAAAMLVPLAIGLALVIYLVLRQHSGAPLK